MRSTLDSDVSFKGEADRILKMDSMREGDNKEGVLECL